MGAFRPKEVLRQARELEARGDAKEAAVQYASLSSYLRRRGKYQEAFSTIQKAATLSPAIPRLQLQLALCAQLHGDLAVAEDAAARAATLARESGKMDKMRAAAEKALEEYPKLLERFYRAAGLSKAVERVAVIDVPPEPEGSVSEFEALTEEKTLGRLIEELEKELGTGFVAHKEIEPLIEEFQRRSQNVLGADARARIDMALAYFEMGLLDQAQQEIALIEKNDPLFVEAQALSGQIWLASGNALSALEVFQACLRHPTRTPAVELEARYQLVLVYFRLGDVAEALTQAESLERLDPEYRDLKTLKEQLEAALSKKGGARAV